MKMLDAAVAIITPYYNTGSIFHETAQSVLRQTLVNWQWIIVNDGSVDSEAIAVLQPFRELDHSRIRVIDQPNRGLPAARNVGVAATNAPLLFFLDSDDLISPTALEKLVTLLDNDTAAAFATTWNTVFGSQSLRWRHGFESRATFPYENMATAISIVRRHIFERVGGFDETRTRGLEDYEFWLRCAEYGYWGRDIPEFLIHLRRKQPQEYRGYSWSTRDDTSEYTAFQREMRSRYPTVFRVGVPQLPPLSAPCSDLHNSTQATTVQDKPAIYWVVADLTSSQADALRDLEPLIKSQLPVCMLVPKPIDAEIVLQLEPQIDVYVLPHVLHPCAIPSFLHNLLQRRPPYSLIIDSNAHEHPLAAFMQQFVPEPIVSDFVPNDLATVLNQVAAMQQEVTPIPKMLNSDLEVELAASIVTAPVPSQQAVALQYAVERIGLLLFPMTQALRWARLQLVTSTAWRLLGPLWRSMKRAL